ncbi:hypothetical protein [Sphingorhabdus pulchriflava]|nr:hypothetical protein [Sphingorhabdus pulchriflava]
MATSLAAADAAPAAPAQLAKTETGGETLHYTIIGTRFGNRFKWTVGPDGKGEVAIPFSIGHLIPAAENDYYFLQGEHPIDIGADGYAELRSALSQIVERGPMPLTLDGPWLECRMARTMDLGAAQLRWTKDAKEGMVFADFGCRNEDKAVDEMLARFALAWQLLGRRLSEQGGDIAIAVPKDSKPFEWNEKLRYNEVGPMGAGGKLLELNPNGTGKIVTEDHISWYADKALRDQYFIPAGESRFDIGRAGYLKVRASLDGVIAGRVAPMIEPWENDPDNPNRRCMSDQPFGILKWSEDKDQKGYRFDRSCYTDKNEAIWAMLAPVYPLIVRNLLKSD